MGQMETIFLPERRMKLEKKERNKRRARTRVRRVDKIMGARLRPHPDANSIDKAAAVATRWPLLKRRE